MSAIACTQCKKPLMPDLLNTPGFSTCNSCGVQLKVRVFPALYREIPRGQGGETAIVAEESTCFYHPEKKAVVPCEGCGRFLCGLCDMDINGKHLCPACMERGVKIGKLVDLENQRTLYDSLALALAVWPVILVVPVVYFGWLTAPLALYVSIRHWNAPTSILPRGKIRFIIAIILAALQIAVWIILIVTLIRHLW
jgi:hypothetical protein